ncbi:MAG: hypothetical protein QM681_14520 [Novosphingobium sp.]
MSGSPTIHAALPEDCSDTERERFFDLVVEGGEVGGAVLATNIAEARILVMLIGAGTVCGIAALKRPRKSYRDNTSAKSEVSLDAATYAFMICSTPLRASS